MGYCETTPRDVSDSAKQTCPAFKIHIILILFLALPQKVHIQAHVLSCAMGLSSTSQRFPLLSSGEARAQIRKERIGVGSLDPDNSYFELRLW